MNYVIEHIENEVVVCQGDDFLIESNVLYLSEKDGWFDIGLDAYSTISFTKLEMKAIAEYILTHIGGFDR